LIEDLQEFAVVHATDSDRGNEIMQLFDIKDDING